MKILLNSEHVLRNFLEDHASYILYQKLNYYGQLISLLIIPYIIDKNNSKYIQNYMG